MKKALLWGLMGMFLTFSSLYNAKAAHINGGEITYKSAGNDSFDIILTLYRDCNSITISGAQVTVSSSCTTFNTTVLPVSSRDITGVPPHCGVQSRCSGSYTYGFEEWVLKKRVYLGGLSCCDFNLTWKDCCRNTGITGPSYNYYIEATLNKCTGAGNSSPVFNAAPRLLLPVGYVNFVDFSAFDADGDSLAYSFTTPKVSSSANLPYAGYFGYDRPCTFQGFPNPNTAFPGGFRINNETGNVIFKPTKQNEFFHYAVKVTEWRKVSGACQKIGEINRDIQTIIVPSASNSIPQFLDEVAENSICNGAGTYCINIPVIDADNDPLSFTFGHHLSNITFNNTGTVTKPIIRVCYTPTPAELTSGLPLLFKITVSDNVCTLAGIAEKIFLFKPKPELLDSFGIQKTVACNALHTEFSNPAQSMQDAKPHWTITSHKDTVKSDSAIVDALLSDTGWYRIKMAVYHADYCDTVTHYDSVYIPLSNFISVALGKDTSVCFDSLFGVSPVIINGNTPFTYNWSTGDTLPAINPHLVLGTNLYVLEVTDANGCKAVDSLGVSFYNPTVVLSGDTVKCANKPLTLTATITDATKPVFQWSGYTAGLSTISISLTASTTFTFNLTDSAGCTVTKQYHVTVYNPQLSLQKTSVCEVDSIPLSATTTGGLSPYGYSWSPFSLSGSSIMAPPQSSGPVPFSVTVTDAFGCTTTKTDTVLILQTPVLILTQPGPVCQSSTPISLSSYAAPLGGVWTGAGVSGNLFNPSVSGAGTFTLAYSYTDSLTGCSNQSGTNIDVQPQPKADFTVDATSADTGHIFSFTDATQNPVSTFRDWNFGDPASGNANTSNNLNPTHKFSDTGWYTVWLRVSGGICPDDTATKANYIYVYKTGSIGISQVKKPNVKIYPNPAQDRVNIEAVFTIEKIQVTDVLGKKFLLPLYTEGNGAIINTESLKAGIYFITIYGAGGKGVLLSVVISK